MKRSSKNFSVYVFFAVVIALIVLLVINFSKQAKIPENEIISRNGLHWHPRLTITIQDKELEIPANIGLGLTESPIHTHDALGEIHLEFTGLVTQDDIRLKKFFKVWKKPFNQNQILDYTGRVRFLVNGQENHDYGEYIMRDKDKLEIIAE